MRQPTLIVHSRPAVENLEERRLLAGTPSGLLTNVPQAAGYKVVYDLNIPKLGGNFTQNGVPYSVNNSATAGTFDRVGYYLELKASTGATQWVFVSANAFTTDARKIGVPKAGLGAVFNQNLVNMDVYSNVPSIAKGTGLAGGRIEFWPNKYSPVNASGVPGASGTAYDFGDTPITGTPGTGSMQIHNKAAGQTVFAYNDWGGVNPAQDSEVGIGNSPIAGKDWTGNNSAGQWSVRRMQVLVRPTNTSPAPSVNLGQILPLGDSITWGYSWKEALTGGYRTKLLTNLNGAGRSFRYVGSVEDTFAPSLKGTDQDMHEGHGGYRTDQILGNLAGVVAGSNVSPNNGGYWITGKTGRPAVYPNIILLHVGTNDFLQGKTVASALANLDQIIVKLTTLRPNAKLFVSNIIPILTDATATAKVKEYNAKIKDVLIPKHKAAGKKVVFVDQYKNFVDSAGKPIATFFPDKVHPNRAGYDRIANTWSQAILAN